MGTHDRPDFEKMIAVAEANAIKSRPFVPGPEAYPALQAKPKRALEIGLGALPGLGKRQDEFDQLLREHDAELDRLAADARKRALDGAKAASKRLEALTKGERTVLAGLPTDWAPNTVILESVDFIRSWPTPGNLLDSSRGTFNWAEYRVRDSQGATLRPATEKVSFYNYWQNQTDGTVLADIRARLAVNGHCACHADWGGVASWFFPNSESRIDVSARLTIWGAWTEPAPQLVVDEVPLGSTSAHGGFFSDGNQTDIEASPVLSTVGFAIPARGWIMIEASVVVDYEMLSGNIDADFASGDLRAKWSYAIITIPRTMTVNP